MLVLIGLIIIGCSLKIHRVKSALLAKLHIRKGLVQTVPQ
jgi:hypothetical protein